jgi:glycosyltransferase involved in cell wall biosynthesis
VGTDDNVDKQLPPNIISIHRTANQTELAEIYTAADLFVNPTREENFPTVNIEALACGTPVLTYRTGGSPEMLDENSGMVVERNDEEALYNAIIEIERTRPFTAENCRKQAEKFSNDAKYREYVSLYKAK